METEFDDDLLSVSQFHPINCFTCRFQLLQADVRFCCFSFFLQSARSIFSHLRIYSKYNGATPLIWRFELTSIGTMLLFYYSHRHKSIAIVPQKRCSIIKETKMGGRSYVECITVAQAAEQWGISDAGCAFCASRAKSTV